MGEGGGLSPFFSSIFPPPLPQKRLILRLHLTVTRKRHPFRYDYKLNNNSIKHVSQIKDLGVTSRRTSHGTLTLTLSQLRQIGCSNFCAAIVLCHSLFFISSFALDTYILPIDDYVKPKGTRLTRHSSDQDVVIPKCLIKLFQFSYFNRTLSSLNQFKSNILQRYSAAFRTNYDVTNFNTWKSICCKCSRSRNLLFAGNCFY